MYLDFPAAVLEDMNGDDVTVTVTTDAAGRHCVHLATKANLHPHSSSHIDTEAARAIAAALTEAADEADSRQLSDDAAELEAEERADAARAVADGWPGCRLAARGADFWHAARDFAPATLCRLPLAGSGLAEHHATSGQAMCGGCATVAAAELVTTGQIDPAYATRNFPGQDEIDRPLLWLTRSQLDARIAAGDAEAIRENQERT